VKDEHDQPASAKAEGRLEGVEEATKLIKQRSEYLAIGIVKVTRWLLILLLLAAALFEASHHEQKEGIAGWIAIGLFVALNALAFAHLTGIEVLSKPLTWFQAWVARTVFSLLNGGSSRPSS
jgi:hypothetical protein